MTHIDLMSSILNSSYMGDIQNLPLFNVDNDDIRVFESFLPMVCTLSKILKNKIKNQHVLPPSSHS